MFGKFCESSKAKKLEIFRRYTACCCQIKHILILSTILDKLKANNADWPYVDTQKGNNVNTLSDIFFVETWFGWVLSSQQ